MVALNKIEKIETAVVRHHIGAKEKLLDKAFAFAFKGLVYAQIWEDPVVDMQALQIQPGARIATIASGGCNVLSYLTADPTKIVAVDLNTAHIALNKLKRVAAMHLPDYAHFRRFFADANDKANIAAYHDHVAPHLDAVTRGYWEGRDLLGRKRIGGFAKGLYRRGLLGHFIALAHLTARVHKIDPKIILSAQTMDEQRTIFDQHFSPLFDRKFIRWLTDQPASLFGLGIPPAQYDSLAGEAKMADVLKARLEKLACDFDLKDNYFAWQAFGRSYGQATDAPLPPYLQEAHYDAVRARAERVDVRHANMTDMLAASEHDSFDCYLFLDAQDWMTDEQLNDLWRQVTRTSRPGARVVFRTAAEETLLAGRVLPEILECWDYRAEESLAYTTADRSAIYGGVHLYVAK